MWFEVEESKFLAAIEAMMVRTFTHHTPGTFELITDGANAYIYGNVYEPELNCSFKIRYGFGDFDLKFKVVLDYGKFFLVDEQGVTVTALTPCVHPKSNFWIQDLPEECYGAFILGNDGSTHEVLNHDGVPSVAFARGTEFVPINECWGAVRIAFARKYWTVTMKEI